MDNWLHAVFQWLHQRSDTSQFGLFELIPKLLLWYNDIFLITFLNKHKLTWKQYSRKESNQTVKKKKKIEGFNPHFPSEINTIAMTVVFKVRSCLSRVT